jgi:hypothetical protein
MKSSLTKPNAGAIPQQNLDAISCAIAEEKRISRTRVMPETGADLVRKPIDSLAHIGRFRRHPDCALKLNHGRSWMTTGIQWDPSSQEK